MISPTKGMNLNARQQREEGCDDGDTSIGGDEEYFDGIATRFALFALFDLLTDPARERATTPRMVDERDYYLPDSGCCTLSDIHL